MRPITHLLLTGFLFFSFSWLNAQDLVLSLSPSTATAPIGGTFTVDIKVVSGFTNVTTLQIPVVFDKNVLELTAVGNLAPLANPALVQGTNYNINSPSGSSGNRIVFTWDTNPNTQPNGATLPNGTNFATLTFKVKVSGVVKIEIKSTTQALEVIGLNTQAINVNTSAAVSTVTAGSGGGGGGTTPIQGFKIIANTVYIGKDQIGCMPVTVNDFNSLIGLQFGLTWDPLVLQYECVRNFNLPGFSEGDFAQVGNNTLTMAWGDPGGGTIGETRANGTSIFEVCFKGVGNAGTQSLVQIGNYGLPSTGGVEAGNAAGQNLITPTFAIADTLFVNTNPIPANGVTFSVDQEELPLNSTGCVDVRAKGFTGITSVDLPLVYDTTVLRLQSVRAGSSLMNISTGAFGSNPNFNRTFVAGQPTGILRFVWGNSAGVTLPSDTTTIFRACFLTKGAANTVTPLTLGSNGNCAPVGVTRLNAGSRPTAVVSGSVTIKGASITVAAPNVTNAKCANLADGSIAINPSGCTGTYTYLWSNGQTTAIANNLAAGTYTVTITCSSGGTATATATVTQPSAITIPSPSVVNANCTGTTGGSITLAPTGGTPISPTQPYRYTWLGGTFSSPGNTNTPTIMNIRAATYMVTATDGNSCTATTTIVVNATTNTLSLPSAQQTTKTNANCAGTSGGSITLAPTGGTMPYNYAWAAATGNIPGSNTNKLDNIAAGTYTATVTDASQCTAVVPGIVVSATPSPVSIPAPVVVNTNCTAATGSVTVSPANGATPYSFEWKKSGAVISSALTNVLSNVAVGNYEVKATDANGCTATATANVTALQSTVNATSTTTPSTCFEPGTGSINLTASGGRVPYTVSWTGPGGYTSTATSPTGLKAGNYRAVVTDQDGCAYNTPNIAVGGPTEALSVTPSVTTILCPNGKTGAISLAPKGGTGPNYTYAWTGPNNFTSMNQNITDLAAGTYTVTIRDANQCSFTAPVIVTAPAAFQLNVAQTASTCGNNGTIQINPNGGTSPYSVTWTGPNGLTSTATSLSNLRPGTYNLTLRDAAGCTLTLVDPIILAGTSNPMVLTATPKNTKCHNDPSGGALLGVTGGGAPVTSYTWFNTGNTTTPVGNMKDLDNVLPGTYTVIVRDANGCSATLGDPILVLGPPSPLAVNVGPVTGATCPEAASGSISLVINGGWGGPYDVTWSGGLPPVTNPTNIKPGIYTPVVTDRGGCVVTAQPVTVPGPPAMTLSSIKADSVRCAGDATGRITIEVAGGNGAPYSAIWAGALSGLSISQLPGNKTYTPTVSDKNGCTKVFDPIFVGQPDSITVTFKVTQQSGTLSNGAIDITVKGGVKPYSYEWQKEGNNYATTEDLNNLAAGTYKVFVKDAKSCGLDQEIVVPIDNPLVGAVIDTVKNSCDDDGCIRIKIPSAAIGPFVVRWSSTGTMTTTQRLFSVCSLKSDIYTITITDVASTRTFTLSPTNVTQLPRASYGAQRIDPNTNLKNGSITLDPNMGAPLRFTWKDGFTGPVRIGLDSGCYMVTAYHLTSGCTAMETICLKRQYPPLVVNGTPVNERCAGNANGSISLSVSGGNAEAGYKYAWTGPNGFNANTAFIDKLVPGIYNVTVTDGNGTTAVYNTTIVALSNLKVTNVNETSNYNAFQVSGADKCDGAAEVVASGGAGTLSYQWSNSVSTRNNTTLCGGVYSVTVTDNLGCTAVWKDSLSVPKRLLAPVQFTRTITCAGRCDASVRATIAGGISPYKVVWSVDAGVTETVGVSGGFTERFNLCPGSYTVTITDGNDITQVSAVTVAAKDPITVNINDNIIPTSYRDCDGELLAEAAGTTGNVNYAWSSNRGNRGTERRAEGLCPGEVVTFIITDGNGCTATVFDTVPNPSNGCLQARPVITPGEQDGKNDVFIIACIEEYQNSVEIYDRWGQLVFQAENYDNSSNVWDGTSRNGNPLPEGVYFYVINYTDGSGARNQVKGYVNLIR